MELNSKWSNKFHEVLIIDSYGNPSVIRNRKGRISYPCKNQYKKRQSKGCFGKCYITEEIVKYNGNTKGLKRKKDEQSKSKIIA